MLQCVAVCCSVLQSDAVCNIALQSVAGVYLWVPLALRYPKTTKKKRSCAMSVSFVAAFGSALRCVVVLQCVAMQCVAECCCVLLCTAAGYCELQCVAVSCSVLQCVAVRYSATQCVAERCSA